MWFFKGGQGAGAGAEFEIPCGEKPRKKQGRNTEYKVTELSSGVWGRRLGPFPAPRAAALMRMERQERQAEAETRSLSGRGLHGLSGRSRAWA